ncbi:MAG TPA: hypothetical protein VEU08_16890 [Vicinamibacterales bacterium]|nr:hypothetical protein [Vicinamibacterales bacterium]
MRKTFIAFSASIVGAVAIAALGSHVATAQSPKPAAAKATTQQPAVARPAAAKPAIKRTADGHPDFSGMYNIETMTPLSRPAGIKNLVLTPEEAAAAEKYEAERQQHNDASLDPNRGAPPVGGERTQPKSYLEFLEQAGGGVVGGYNHFWLSEGSKMITVDGQKRSSIVIDPPDGHVPAMKDGARARNARLRAASVDPSAAENAPAGPAGAFDGPELRPLAERCLLGFGSTSGPPILPNYFYNNLHQIVQTPTQVMILTEMVHDARVVRMNAEHLPPTIRKWMGDSVGRWDGDTLVVDTTNFTEKTQFNGSGPNLHIVERFTRVDPKTLLYRFTVEDPDTWDHAWTGEYPWPATGDKLYEYACAEGNYALGDMLRGARAAEREAASKSEKK